MSPRQFLSKAILMTNLHIGHVLHVLTNLHVGHVLYLLTNLHVGHGHVLTNVHVGHVLHFCHVKFVFSGVCKMSSHSSVPRLLESLRSNEG